MKEKPRSGYQLTRFGSVVPVDHRGIEIVVKKNVPSFYTRNWQVQEIGKPKKYYRETGMYRFTGLCQDELWVNSQTGDSSPVVRRTEEFRQAWK